MSALDELSAREGLATASRSPSEPGPRGSGQAVGIRSIDRALIAYARGLEHPGKLRIVRWLARRLAGNGLQVRYGPGAAFVIDPHDYIGWAILRTGSYEPATLALALRILGAQAGLFVDVGAHCGWFGCAAALLPGVCVVGIEADCGNCAALRDNIVRNRLTNVAVVNVAVGAEIGMGQTIRRARTNSGTTAIRQPDEAADPAGNWVAVLPLDDLLPRLVRPAVRPALVKLDIEGGERDALAGLDLAGPYRPHHIIMEYEPALSGSAWGSADALRRFFAENGYDVRDVLGRTWRGSEPPPEANLWISEAR